jgi:hypothetical protein
MLVNPGSHWQRNKFYNIDIEYERERKKTAGTKESLIDVPLDSWMEKKRRETYVDIYLLYEKTTCQF